MSLRERIPGSCPGGGLTLRMALASGLLIVILGAAFVVLFLNIDDFRQSTQSRRDTRQQLAQADELEKLVLDLETGVRGFVITGEERFLTPWSGARAAFPERAAALERLVGGDPVRLAPLRGIAQAETSYVRDYALPLIAAVRRGDATARSVARTEAGKRRVDGLRARFDAFAAGGRADLARQEAGAERAGDRAIAAAGVAVGGSILLVLLFTGYLARVVVRPIRRAALMANRLSGGDLGARLPEDGVGEIATLEQSLNVMAGSLEAGREDLTRLAEEQAALRRVATLVAQRALAAELFAAVAEEARALLGTDVATIARREPDGTATMMGGSWPGFPRMAVGSRWTLDGFPAIRQVLQSGRSVRVDDYSGASGPVHDVLRRAGVRSSLGSPIAVEGRLWGAMVVSSTHGALPADIETRMQDFTELVATAIANAESRGELSASRARIVQTGDEERRRIERNLHDGAQQRLVSLGMTLHAAAAAIPADAQGARDELARVGSGIDGVIEDLREIARGIHPAILSEGGLRPALRTLARRSSVPVVLNVSVAARLPEGVEVVGYYVVAEALTNAAKHARASAVHVDVEVQGATLRLVIRDDGLGGADPARGSGLVGLRDRVEAMGGTVAIESPVGTGTSLVVELPLGGTA